MTTLIDVIADATLQATAEIILRKHLSPDIYELTEALKRVTTAGYPALLKDLKDAEFMGEPMMKEILSVGCIDLAVKALKEVGALPVDMPRPPL